MTAPQYRATHRKPIPKRSPARAEAIDLLSAIVRDAVALQGVSLDYLGDTSPHDIADNAYRLADMLGLDIAIDANYDEPQFR